MGAAGGNSFSGDQNERSSLLENVEGGKKEAEEAQETYRFSEDDSLGLDFSYGQNRR